MLLFAGTRLMLTSCAISLPSRQRRLRTRGDEQLSTAVWFNQNIRGHSAEDGLNQRTCFLAYIIFHIVLEADISIFFFFFKLKNPNVSLKYWKWSMFTWLFANQPAWVLQEQTCRTPRGFFFFCEDFCLSLASAKFSEGFYCFMRSTDQSCDCFDGNFFLVSVIGYLKI